jgi:hypothetical protein
MSKEIIQFIGRTKELAENSGLSSGIAGSTKPQSVLMDLFKAATRLHDADTITKVDAQLLEVVGVLHVAQAMNVIGFEDLEELMDLLDKIKSKED